MVLTSLVTMVFLGGSFHLIRQSTSPIAVRYIIVNFQQHLILLNFFIQIGFLVGSSGMLAVLSLITGIYWSKLSHCEHYDNAEIAQYSCGNTAAYTSVSFFSIMLFIMELLCACLVFSWRTDLIDEVGRYDEISESTGGISNLPTFNPYSNSPKVYGGEVYGRIEERSAEL